MKPALTYHDRIHAFTSPLNWDDIPHGQFICEQTEQYLSPWLSRMFGYHLLKLGSLSCQVNTSASPIKHQVRVSDQVEHAGVIADIDELPFSEHSIDAAIMAHCLEYSHDPHHILREVHRTLLPGGYLVITGFNPLCLSGMMKFMPYYRSRFPWSGRYFTSSRVKDWLNLLGFEILSDEKFIYSSLTRNSTFAKSPGWHSFCEKHVKSLGSIYMLIARKRVLPLTPIKPRWHAKPQFSPAVKGATYTQSRR